RGRGSTAWCGRLGRTSAHAEAALRRAAPTFERLLGYARAILRAPRCRARRRTRGGRVFPNGVHHERRWATPKNHRRTTTVFRRCETSRSRTINPRNGRLEDLRLGVTAGRCARLPCPWLVRYGACDGWRPM